MANRTLSLLDEFRRKICESIRWPLAKTRRAPRCALAMLEARVLMSGSPAAPVIAAPLAAVQGGDIIVAAATASPDAAGYEWQAWLNGDYDTPLATQSGAIADGAIPDFVLPNALGDGYVVMSLAVTDRDGARSDTVWSDNIWLQNVSPTVSVAGPASMAAGQAATFSGTFTDPGIAGEDYTYAWFVYGPGFDGYYAGGQATAGAAGDLVFTPTSSDPYTVSLEIYDSNGGYGYANATTDNTAPIVTLTRIGQAGPLEVGNVVTYDCTSIDHDVQAMTFEWTASRFDAATQQYVVQETYTAGSTFQFILAAEGDYVVTVTTTDVAGASATASASLVTQAASPVTYVSAATAGNSPSLASALATAAASVTIDWGVYFDQAGWELLTSLAADPAGANDMAAGGATLSLLPSEYLETVLADAPVAPAAQIDDLGIYSLELDLTA